MVDLLLLSILSCYLLVAGQDFKFREVHLFLYILLYMLHVIGVGIKYIVLNATFIYLNLSVVLVVATLLTMYYLLRYKTKGFKKLNDSIGLGDLLIFPFFIFYFSPFNFMLIFTISLLISLISYVFLKTEKIPLAGVQSLVLTFMLVLNHFNILNMQTDFFYLN